MDKTFNHYYQRLGNIVIAAAAWTDEEFTSVQEERTVKESPPVFTATGC